MLSKLLIRGATILTMEGPDAIIETGEILMEDGWITHVGLPGSAPGYFDMDEVIEADGEVAMPGFVNCHTHAAMTLLRGYADDMSLMPWLSEKIWPFEDRLTGDAAVGSGVVFEFAGVNTGATGGVGFVGGVGATGIKKLPCCYFSY